MIGSGSRPRPRFPTLFEGEDIAQACSPTNHVLTKRLLCQKRGSVVQYQLETENLNDSTPGVRRSNPFTGSRLSWGIKFMTSKAKLIASLSLWLATLAPAFSAGNVLINEIMYHPASTNLLEEWFELYNPGPTNVSLRGWQMTKGVQFAFPTNASISAGGFLVVAADTATFAVKNPGVTNVVAASAGPLRGHTLAL